MLIMLSGSCTALYQFTAAVHSYTALKSLNISRIWYITIREWNIVLINNIYIYSNRWEDTKEHLPYNQIWMDRLQYTRAATLLTRSSESDGRFKFTDSLDSL